MRLSSEITPDSQSPAVAGPSRQSTPLPSAAAVGMFRDDDSLFRQFFLQAPVALAMIDLDGRLLHVNENLCALLGYAQWELTSCPFISLILADEYSPRLDWLRLLDTHGREPTQFPARLRHNSGREIFASLCISTVKDSAGKPLRFVIHVQDETERRRQECFENDRRLVLEMVAQDQPLPAVLNQVVGLVERQMPGLRTSVMLLQDGMIRPFGASIPAQLADALARKPVSFVANLTSGPDELGAVRVAEVQSDAAWEGLRDEATAAGVACCWALTLRGNDAVPFGLLIVLAPEHREPTAAEALVLEIALHLGSVGIEHYQTTRQLAHLVRHDPLTGLPNRVLFEDRLHQALASARRHNRPLGLLALDLNRFKHVNDTLGHQAGDSLLQQFSMRLRSKLRESDTLARVGGDEFLVILPDVASRDEAEVVTQRLRDALACAPFEVGGQSLAATASIGIAMYPQDADDTAPLQRAADAAMYRAKEAGRRNEAHTLLSKSA